MTDSNYYDILKVSKDASPEAIKKSYKKLALKSHPDKNPENREESSRKFTEISEAYEALSDPDKRKKYDQFGKAGLGEQAHGSDHFQEMFKGMFGGGNPFAAFQGIPGMESINSMFGNRQNAQEPEGDMQIKIGVPLASCYTGDLVKISFPRKSNCPGCLGHGSDDGKNYDCDQCAGKGSIVKVTRNGPFVQQQINTCSKCSGNKVSDGYTPCLLCSGKKTITESHAVQFYIPKGAEEGETINLPQEGSVSTVNKDGSRYDVNVIIQTNGDSGGFQRDPNRKDLQTEITLSLAEALCGFSREIIHLDGRKISVVCEEICSPEHRIIVSGEGMRKTIRGIDCAGDLIITVKITYPSVIQSRRALWSALETEEFTPHSNSANVSVEKISSDRKRNDPTDKPGDCKPQ